MGGAADPRTWAGAPPWARVDRSGVAATAATPLRSMHGFGDGRPCHRHGLPSLGADAVAGGKAGVIAGFAVAADLRSTAWLVLLDYGYPAIVVVGVEIAGSLVLRLAMRPVAEGFVLRKPAA